MPPFSLRNLFDWKKEYLCQLLLVQILISIPLLLLSSTLWLDEAYSALMARNSFVEILSAMRFDAGPPLYYLLLHSWRMVFGESEIALSAFIPSFFHCRNNRYLCVMPGFFLPEALPQVLPYYGFSLPCNNIMLSKFATILYSPF